MIKIAIFLLLLLSPAFGQSVQQSGNVTPGHVTQWITDGVVGDGGSLGGGATLSGMFNAFDFLCANSLSNTPLIISCGLSATNPNTWNGIQTFAAVTNLSGGATSITRSPLDSTTNVATTAFVTSAIAALQVTCGGVSDYAAVQAAVTAAAATGGLVRLTPGKTCAMGTNTLSFGGSGVTIDGGDVDATTLLFTNTANDSVRMGNGSGLGGWAGNALKNITIRDTSRTSGQTILVLGASQPQLDTVTVDTNGANMALLAQQFNDMNVRTSRFYGGVTLFSPANNAQRSDQFTIDNSVIVPNTRMDCLHIDGMVQTINSNRLVMLNCAVGMNITNNSHSASFFPEFGTFLNLQIDGATGPAVWIQAGKIFDFVGANLGASASTTDVAVVQIDADASFSHTGRISFTGSQINDGWTKCLVVGADDVTIVGSKFFDCGHGGSNTYPAIDIVGGSRINITGNNIGFVAGQPNTTNYGVQIENGVVGPIILGSNSYAGNATGAINDGTGAAIIVGGIDITGSVGLQYSPIITPTVVATAVAATVSAGQIGYGSTTVAPGAGTCPSGTVGSMSAQTVVGCIVVNIAGTARNVPFF